jgi:3-phenylpropionate/trans-cinnamate dioxygenase ferredoxin reductase subunit
VPAEVAKALHERHIAEGVSFHLGVGIARITDAAVVLSDDTVVRADLVVVGIGAVPNTELAVAVGLAVDNGIAVDATLATSDPDIFAAGDCCSFPQPLYDDRRVRLESWCSAQEQGTLAARNMLGAAEPVSSVPWFWSDQYDLSLQIAGLAERASADIRRDLKDGGFVLFHLGPDGRLLAASGIGARNTVARDIRLAEMLIARRARPDPAALADPAVNLKRLL